ncbi:uncharacterized protein MAM_03184 [Metarhizium album ARSEF 1941]|uniref:Uncharacterized protein n=1 Tax=Metarhizium album (strain ARSEF 1941) TaxID=1081103 RepID=A0A0B2WZ65_METAS|nr:uncharacterized protein MAM_03184 [Metarhizium album ARSEF 1941]KHN98722.1 hypothetical protein MAM_03184 [Metarhizium album ARSEF 1941]
MGTPSAHAMPEHWTELNVAKRQRKLCSEAVGAIKTSCRAKCSKENVLECQKCYCKLMDTLRARYGESEDREWFAQRRAFLHELDGLFQDAKDRRRSLKSIDARVESEKEAWYRWVLRRYPEFIALSDRGFNQEELRSMLDDPDRSREELVKTMLDGIGKPPDWPEGVDNFAEKAGAVKDNAADLKQLYIAEFFINQSTGEVFANAQKYLDEYRNSEGLTLEDIIDKIVLDFQQSRGAQPQRESHQRRLDELRRAKRAFEQNKMQTKSLRGVQAENAGSELYDLPPCLVCGNGCDTVDVLSCTLCQALVQIGGEEGLTVYCSEECYFKGHDDHVESQHDCEAGDKCVQLTDEDVEMGDAISRAVICTGCLDLKKATVYCSERCAVVNIAIHRRRKHGAEAAEEEGSKLTSPLQVFVDSTLQSRNPGLKMTRVD